MKNKNVDPSVMGIIPAVVHHLVPDWWNEPQEMLEFLHRVVYQKLVPMEDLVTEHACKTRYLTGHHSMFPEFFTRSQAFADLLEHILQQCSTFEIRNVEPKVEPGGDYSIETMEIVFSGFTYSCPDFPLSRHDQDFESAPDNVWAPESSVTQFVLGPCEQLTDQWLDFVVSRMTDHERMLVSCVWGHHAGPTNLKKDIILSFFDTCWSNWTAANPEFIERVDALVSTRHQDFLGVYKRNRDLRFLERISGLLDSMYKCGYTLSEVQDIVNQATISRVHDE